MTTILTLALSVLALGDTGAGAHPTTPAASEILAKAQERQGGDDLARELKNVEARLIVTLRDEKENANQLKVERRFSSEGKIWTRVIETVSNSDREQGYDGKSYWLWDANLKRVDLTGAEHQADRHKIEQDIDQMRLLMKVFFIKSLEPQLKNLQRLDDDSRDGILAYTIEGDSMLTQGGKDTPVKVRLWFLKSRDVKEKDGPVPYDLLGVRVTRADGSPPDTLCFWNHEKTEQNVIMPGLIKIFHGDEKKPSTEIAFSDLRFNAKLSDSSFEPSR
jgi:hypothetical protein